MSGPETKIYEPGEIAPWHDVLKVLEKRRGPLPAYYQTVVRVIKDDGDFMTVQIPASPVGTSAALKHAAGVGAREALEPSRSDEAERSDAQ